MFRAQPGPASKSGSAFFTRHSQEVEQAQDSHSQRSYKTDSLRNQPSFSKLDSVSAAPRRDRTNTTPDTRNLVVATPNDENPVLESVIRRFKELKDDELSTEWALKEFLIRCKEKPQLFVNFQRPMDDRTKQVLILSLYESIESLSGLQSSSNIDLETIAAIKNEMEKLNYELEMRMQELVREKAEAARLQQEVDKLRELIQTIHQFRLGYSQWVETVILTFIEVFKLVPTLAHVDEELNEQVKSVMSLIEQFDTGVEELAQDTRELDPFLNKVPSKTAEIRTTLDELVRSRPLIMKAKEFLADYTSREDLRVLLPNKHTFGIHSPLE